MYGYIKDNLIEKMSLFWHMIGYATILYLYSNFTKVVPCDRHLGASDNDCFLPDLGIYITEYKTFMHYFCVDPIQKHFNI